MYTTTTTTTTATNLNLQILAAPLPLPLHHGLWFQVWGLGFRVCGFRFGLCSLGSASRFTVLVEWCRNVVANWGCCVVFVV